MTGSARRHPFRGLFIGLLFGLSVAVLFISFGVVFVGALTPWVTIAVGGLIGLADGLAAPTRGRPAAG